MTTEQYWEVETEMDKSDNLWILGGQIWIKLAKRVQKVRRKINGCGYYTNNFEQNLDKHGGLSDKYGCLG